VAHPRVDRSVHVGAAYVYVDESKHLATEPAPTKETLSAEELAAALREIQRDPDKAVAILEGLVGRAKAGTESVEKLIELAEDLAHLADPAVAAKRAEPILASLLQAYRESRYRDVIKLVSAALSIYLLYERWRTLVSLLDLDRLAAEASGEVAEAARALTDLGVLAQAAGDAPLAGELYERARELVEHGGEHVAAEATGQAAGVVSQAAAHTGVALGVKVAAALAGAVLVAGGATGLAVGDGGWYGLGGGDEEVRAGGDAEVIAFAVRTDASAAGTEDERTGWSLPRDAVEPGDELETCEPLCLYAFVAFDGMRPGTEWSVVASNPGQDDVRESGTWSSEPSYTMQLWAERSGQVISYGSWTFVTTIGGDEVDEAEVALVEAC
jgi:hypothetical protein